MNKFIPKNYKHKKIRKRVRVNQLSDHRTNSLAKSTYKYGLKALDNGLVTSIVMEAARRSITRKLKRLGSLKINGFPFVPVTAKSLGVRMGKGVGSISGWVCPVKKGRILFELDGVSLDLAKAALRGASYKLPFKTKFVSK
jgi:large subunit ribosomal protein L16